MKVALTGGSGFIGHYIIRQLTGDAHSIRAWVRPGKQVPQTLQTDDLSPDLLEWTEGDLATCENLDSFFEGCDAVIHNAFWKPGTRFQGGEGDIVSFVEINLLGTLKLIRAARKKGVSKFIYVSSCAVHDRILGDRKLDEAHPLWPQTHYGAHKAAIEKFVHSYGYGEGYDISCVRPTGVYGLHPIPSESKWLELVKQVVQGRSVECRKGGKEVHAMDVARAISILLGRTDQRGEVFSCYDRYVSQFEVAEIAREISGSNCEIQGEITRPKNQIENQKLRDIGMTFGGEPLLRTTIADLVAAAKEAAAGSTAG